MNGPLIRPFRVFISGRCRNDFVIGIDRAFACGRNKPEFGIRDLLSRYNETGFAKQWGQPAQGRSRRRALSREKSLCQIIVYARIHISA